MKTQNQETWTIFATPEEINKVMNSPLRGLVISVKTEKSKCPFDGKMVDTSHMVASDYTPITEFLGRI